MRFEQWLEFHRKQKPSLMRDIRTYMSLRFDFSGSALPEATMSGGKSVMAGPVARLSNDVASYEALAELTPAEVRERDLFPYKPLAHPLQTVAHMVFPESWIKVHPEHRRIDVDMDFPDAYLCSNFRHHCFSQPTRSSAMLRIDVKSRSTTTTRSLTGY